MRSDRAATPVAIYFSETMRRPVMEYRYLGASGLKVPVLALGTSTFGGQGPLFSALGSSGADEARRMADICLEAGVNLFDSADVYSNGAAEEVLGAAIKGRRDKFLISTKASLPTGRGPNESGSSRHRLIGAVDAALKRTRNRLYRHLSAPWVRRLHADRGGALHLRFARPRRQGALCRRIEFLRLAADEIARHRRWPWLAALCRA